MGVSSNEPFFLSGSDHACLLLHGLGGGAYEFSLLGQALHQQGLTVQAILYPGHDLALPRMPDSTWQAWYGHVQDTFDQLQQCHSTVTVVGFSTGCPLALHLAAQRPVAKLVLLAPYIARLYRPWYVPLPLERLLFSVGWWIQDVPRLRLPIRDEVMRREAEKVAFLPTFNLASVRSAIALLEIVRQELPQIQVPTLIIQSRRDSVVDPAGAQYLYDTLPSPVKILHWLKDSDHIIPLDLERAEVFWVVGSFIVNSCLKR
ncbi:alpha/beta fold hydrolase [Candidatus Cyanaurora vandensis]|uniref:alpha/beta hydrolase n=1 Tax=Candidatus Cyanaurora vandensis TaxID=2714958 RepID=UPI0028F4323E|nr:alpha/beta fold hydrolase [Candidatus Cyanaurora vandensis]